MLSPIFQRVSIAPLERSDDVYNRLLRAIIFQQLSAKAASTIHSRFLALFPTQYPEVDLLLDTPIETLRAAGLSIQKATYVQNVADFFQLHQLTTTDWSLINDEDIIAQLTQIKGVGQWTVQMILIFTLGRPDVLPLDDLVVKQAIIKLYQITSEGKQLKKDMANATEDWRPHRSLVSRYLWRWWDTLTP